MTAQSPTRVSMPDGIVAEPRSGARHGSTPLALLVLGALLAAGLGGFLGGDVSTTSVRDLGDATLAVRAPEVLRNGEIFEMQIDVEAARDMSDLVIAVDRGLWRDITVNSHIPAPAEESFDEGAFRFHYGPLRAGGSFAIKIDGQVNPPLFEGTAGNVALLDGEQPLGAVPLRIRVLP